MTTEKPHKVRTAFEGLIAIIRKQYYVLFEKQGYVSVNRPIVFTGSNEEKLVVNLEKAGAVAAVYCFIISTCVYRDLKLSEVPALLLQTGVLTAAKAPDVAAALVKFVAAESPRLLKQKGLEPA